MALASTSVVEARSAGNADYGGGFNPGNTSMPTDLAATSGNTSAPVVTSASYSFISRDAGHWLFIKSGTNWTPGWYQIASVSAGAATLTAGVGTAVLYNGATPSNASAGCATTASPSSGTWSIDYSQNTPINFTDLVAATTTTFTSAANPIGKNFIGNIVSVTSGTGWTVTRWEVSSVTGTTGTAANFFTGSTIATGGSTGGTGYLGGPTTLAKACTLCTNQQLIWAQADGTHSPSATQLSVSSIELVGYSSLRGDSGQVTVNGASVSGAGRCFNLGSNSLIANVICTGATGHAFQDATVSGSSATINCRAESAPNSGFENVAVTIDCASISCGAGFNGNTVTALYCLSRGSAGNGFGSGGGGYVIAIGCISDRDGTTSGYAFTNVLQAIACTAYNPTLSGFNCNSKALVVNCIAYGCGVYGFAASSSSVFQATQFRNCAAGSNTSGNWSNPVAILNGSAVASLSGNPFVDPDNGTAANRDFGLNNTAGAGAVCRAAGLPGAFQGLANTIDYRDLGAVQHTDGAGAASTFIFTRRGGTMMRM